MRALIIRMLTMGCLLGLLLTARAQTGQSPSADAVSSNAPAQDQTTPAPSESPSVTNGSATQGQDQTAPTAEAPATGANQEVTAEPGTAAAPEQTLILPVPPTAGAEGERELHLNFHGAPIDMVLSYLSDAAGFIIELDTPVKGKVDIWSSRPVTKEEAVDLLNSVLNKNGYAAIRNGRKLTIVSKEEAVNRDIPVKMGNDPGAIPKNDEIVTQIIPIQFVEAEQLVKDLSPMVSVQRIIANEAGNSIAVTDTQANIRHLVEIIKAIDLSAEDVTELRVFHLEHADPTEMANLLNGLFSGQSSSTTQAPLQFGGFPGGFGGFGGGRFGGFGGGGNAGNARNTGATVGGAQSQRIKRRTQVTAVADPRTSSVVVTATKDLIGQIADMIQDLDHHSPKETSVQVFHLNNADPQQVLPVLQDMFQNSTSSRNNRSTTTQTSPLMLRLQQNQNSSIMNGTGTGTGTGFGGTGRTLGGTTF